MKYLDEDNILHTALAAIFFAICIGLTVLITAKETAAAKNISINKRLVAKGLCEYRIDPKTGSISLVLIAGTNPGDTWSKE